MNLLTPDSKKRILKLRFTKDLITELRNTIVTGDGYDVFVGDIVYPTIFGRPMTYDEETNENTDRVGHQIAYRAALELLVEEIVNTYNPPPTQTVIIENDWK